MKTMLALLSLLVVVTPTYAAVDVDELYKTLAWYQVQANQQGKMLLRLQEYYTNNNNLFTPLEKQYLTLYFNKADASFTEIQGWIPAMENDIANAVAENDEDELEDVAYALSDIHYEINKLKSYNKRILHIMKL